MSQSQENVNVAAKELANGLWSEIQKHAREALVSDGEAITAAIIALGVVTDALLDAAPNEEARAEGEKIFLRAANIGSVKSVH